MPIVERSEANMLRFNKLVEYIVHPVTVYGVGAAGLSKEFKSLYPEMIKELQTDINDNIYNLQHPISVYMPVNGKHARIINLAMRNVMTDKVDETHIETQLTKLREYLIHCDPLASVAMPVLSTNYGINGYIDGLPLMYKCLDDLPNVIQLSMNPDYFQVPPRYLSVIGSRTLESQKLYDFIIDKAIPKMLCDTKLNLTDFSGMVSGGAAGVDRLACGKHVSDKSIANDLNLKPIICHANWDKFRKSAGFVRNCLMMDIATHVIAIIDNNSQSPGTRHSETLIRVKNTINLNNPTTLHVYEVDHARDLHITNMYAV